jgi:hypothetical protein
LPNDVGTPAYVGSRAVTWERSDILLEIRRVIEHTTAEANERRTAAVDTPLGERLWSDPKKFRRAIGVE